MCDYPRLAVDNGLDPETGKHRIKFLPPLRLDMSFEQARSKYGQHLLLLPCGKCPSCLKAYSKQWSVRLMLESLFHDEMCFVTLTYDPKHYTGKPSKRDVQLFLKRLRKAYPEKAIRYFLCCEAGDLTHRYHYHAILFGINFTDGVPVSYNELKQPCYSSPSLEKIWSLGMVSVGEVTPESCAYVARYSLKKKMLHDGYETFLMMSNHPGIGYQFFMSKKDLIYLSDRVYTKQFHGVPIPRYFDKLAENDPMVKELFEKAKIKRVKRGKDSLYTHMIMTGSDSIEMSNVRKWNDNIAALIRYKRGL